MVAIELGYPTAEIERQIVMQEALVSAVLAEKLVRLGQAIRALRNEGLQEGASTRTLITTGRLINAGLDPVIAAEVAIAAPLTDDLGAGASLREMARIYMG